MPRCFACDSALTDFELTRKSAATGEYLDLCSRCFHGLPIDAVERQDLSDETYIEEEEISDVENW